MFPKNYSIKIYYDIYLTHYDIYIDWGVEKVEEWFILSETCCTSVIFSNSSFNFSYYLYAWSHRTVDSIHAGTYLTISYSLCLDGNPKLDKVRSEWIYRVRFNHLVFKAVWKRFKTATEWRGIANPEPWNRKVKNI